VIFPNIITYLDRVFKKEQNDLNLKWNSFIKLVLILTLFSKSVMPKRLTKMLTGIMHKRMH